MPKLENYTNRVVIDGKRYRKNELQPIDDVGDTITVAYTMEANSTEFRPSLLYQTNYSDWTDSNDVAYESKQALLDDMDSYFFSDGGEVTTGSEGTNISSAGTNVLSDRSGVIRRVVINNAIAGGIVTIYDNVIASGTIIATITIPAVLTFNQIVLDYGIRFLNGLTVVTTNNTNITVVYFD